MDILIKFCNFIISSVSSIITFVLSLFPKSPFHYLSLNPTISHYLGYLAWLLPLGFIISFLEAWLVAIGIFYLVQVGARWLKIISQ